MSGHFGIVGRAALLAGALALGACAMPAEPGAMTVGAASLPAPDDFGPFVKAISIKSVAGGEETNPLWTSEVDAAGFRAALRQSLINAGLHARFAVADFDLRATLNAVSQPIVGLDMTVTATVTYVLEERAPLRLWYDNAITASHTATFADAPLAVVRLKLANEGAIRKNIRLFVEDLARLDRPMAGRGGFASTMVQIEDRKGRVEK